MVVLESLGLILDGISAAYEAARCRDGGMSTHALRQACGALVGCRCFKCSYRIDTFASSKLQKIRRAPLQFAATREAFVAQLAFILDLAGLDGHSLYNKFFHVAGTCLAEGMEIRLDEEFARAAVEETTRLWQ